MISDPKAIAYIYPTRTFFVAKDIEWLGRGMTIHEHGFSRFGKAGLLIDLLRQFHFLVRMRRRGVNTVLAHFAGFHTVLPVQLGFRTHIIVAGADACSFPAIQYGSFRKAAMAKAIARSMRGARTILPVHGSLPAFTNTYSELGPQHQGYAHFVRGLATPSIPVPYGFDQALWPGRSNANERAGCLCVATGAANGNAIHFRKGVDQLLAIAAMEPTLAFTFVGVEKETYTNLPRNVRMLGRTPPSELAELMAQHAVYVQPSVMEGFPNALCEAMLQGCIPVVSNMTSMPDIVGPNGIVVEKRDPASILAGIHRAIAPMTDRSEVEALLRARITPFTMERRVSQLRGAMKADLR